jgi:hypothetical protein
LLIGMVQRLCGRRPLVEKRRFGICGLPCLVLFHRQRRLIGSRDLNVDARYLGGSSWGLRGSNSCRPGLRECLTPTVTTGNAVRLAAVC